MVAPWISSWQKVLLMDGLVSGIPRYETDATECGEKEVLLASDDNFDFATHVFYILGKLGKCASTS